MNFSLHPAPSDTFVGSKFVGSHEGCSCFRPTLNLKVNNKAEWPVSSTANFFLSPVLVVAKHTSPDGQRQDAPWLSWLSYQVEIWNPWLHAVSPVVEMVLCFIITPEANAPSCNVKDGMVEIIVKSTSPSASWTQQSNMTLCGMVPPHPFYGFIGMGDVLLPSLSCHG